MCYTITVKWEKEKKSDIDTYWLIFSIELFMWKGKFGGPLCFPSLTKMLLFFFPSKFKSGTQHLNNGDGLSEYVGQSLGEKTSVSESTCDI